MKAREDTALPCPLSCLPVVASHMQTVSSQLPLASLLPSGQIHTHIHTCAPSHGKGGVTIASLLPFFVSPSLTGVCCDYLTGASSCSGSACAAGKHGPAGSTSAATATCSGSACAAGTYGQAGATSSSSATCTSCVAGTYASAAGASGALVFLLRCLLFPHASACRHTTYMCCHAFVLVHTCMCQRTPHRGAEAGS